MLNIYTNIYLMESIGSKAMENFDYTQFITFDSTLPSDILYSKMKELFEELGFEVTVYDEMDIGKKEYYQDYWKEHVYELPNDFFLEPCSDWKDKDVVPKEYEKFLHKMERLCQMDVQNVCLIICSFAEKGRTKDEIVFTTKEGITNEIFKMSIHSWVLPDNLIINIIES